MGEWEPSVVADASTLLGCESQWRAGKKVMRFESSYFDSFRLFRCVDRQNVETVF